MYHLLGRELSRRVVHRLRTQGHQNRDEIGGRAGGRRPRAGRSAASVGEKAKLATLGLWDVNSPNLFRITWKNEPVARGGGFGGVNYVELPPSLTGTPVYESVYEQATGLWRSDYCRFASAWPMRSTMT